MNPLLFGAQGSRLEHLAGGRAAQERCTVSWWPGPGESPRLERHLSREEGLPSEGCQDNSLSIWEGNG